MPQIVWFLFMHAHSHTYRINDLLICITLYLCQSNFRDIWSVVEQPHFALCKWASSKNGKCCSGEEEFREDKLLMKSDGPQLRHRSFSGIVLLSLYEEDTVYLSFWP